ncbi:hypothetical protein [Porphyromonas sp.]
MPSSTATRPSLPLAPSVEVLTFIDKYKHTIANKNLTKVKDKRKAIDIVKLNAEEEQSVKRINDLRADIDEIAKELEA